MHLLEIEDSHTIRKIGINVAALIGVALALVLISVLLG
jgi:hypothetical protein